MNTDSLQGSIKPGDVLYFDITFNQKVSANPNNSNVKNLNMDIGGKTVQASLAGLYSNTSAVSYSSSADAVEFDRMRYKIQMPDTAKDEDLIRLSAEKSGSYWKITNNADWMNAIRGNLIISETAKRGPIDPVTQIVASGNSVLSEIRIDRSAPVLTLTDKNGNSAPVHSTALEAENAAKLYNTYELYIKSDEEVLGNVSAVLSYTDKKTNVTKTLDPMTTGAYTVDPVQDMCLRFSIPANIDSALYDIRLELTAMDTIYNSGTTSFYLAADTLAPTVEIDSNNSGMITTENGSKAWKYAFKLNDNASESGMKLYYRFDGMDTIFSDNDTNFTVLSKEYTNDTIAVGSIEYYAEDGMGNASKFGVDGFFVTDTASLCTPVDSIAEIGNKFNPPRELEFTGFKEPVTAEDKTFCYYLVYKIGAGGEYKAILSENGENVAIPAQELQRDCMITYYMVSARAEDLADSMTEESLSMQPHGELLYRCDNEAPRLKVELTENHVGNTDSMTILAPVDDHPANITKMEIALFDNEYNQIGETLDVTESFLAENTGAVIATIYLENILDRYDLPSGEYSMEVTLTDANGHSGTYKVLDREPIINDEPVLTEVEILTQDGAVVSVMEEDGSVVIDEDALRKAAYAGAFADGFQIRTSVMMRYEGDNFPDCDLEYIFSMDGGANWTTYTDLDLVVEDKSLDVIEGKTYIVYTVIFPMPEQELDGISQILVRMNCSRNPYISEPVRVSTLHDNIAPLISVMETEVGSDENGWYAVDYTNDSVKLVICAEDIGIFKDVVDVSVINILQNGKIVNRADYDTYIELDAQNTQAIVKENCTITFEARDAWGNVSRHTYTCHWIDDLTTGVEIYTSEPESGVVGTGDTELFTYFTVRNYSDFVLAAVKPGSTEITDADIARFEAFSYTDNDEDEEEDEEEEEEQAVLRASRGIVMGTETTEIVEVEMLATMAANRNGDLSSILRIYQRQLCSETYDIVCGVYDRRGNLQVIPLMTVVSEEEEILVEDFTSTVTGLGYAVNAVQVLTFNKPVAQLDDDLVEEIIEDGYIPTRNDINFRELAFAKTICAVIEDDNVRSDTVAEVYVTDVYGQIAKVEVDITGTTFIDYEGYTIAYYDNGELVDDDHIFGENSNITLKISGNDGVSILLPDSDVMEITTEGEAVPVGSDSYYYKLSMNMDMEDIRGEGYYYAANLRIRNTISLEEYTDAVVFQYDTKPPVLVDAVEILRNDLTDPGRVVYIFYDRRQVEEVYEIVDGAYVEQISQNGIYYAEYIENTEHVVAALDSEGNMSSGHKGPDIDDVVTTGTLKEGLDFALYTSDVDGNALKEGAFYQTVLAEIRKLDGGKDFTVEPAGVMEITTERPVIFKLTDENGGTTLHQYIPPIDRTPPEVKIVQNNAGGMVTQLIYTITATDEKSGVARVYLPLEDEERYELELTPEEDNPNKYLFITRSSQEFELVVVDALGNETRKLLTPNSTIVGDLQVNAVYNPSTGFTNSGTRATISSTDGRRVYLTVDNEAEETTLLSSAYLISGANIFVTENGTAKVICTDEMNNKAEIIIAVSNIDKTPPAIEATVSDAYIDGTHTLDTTRKRVTFSALGEDNIPDKVYLLRKTDEDLSFEGNSMWEKYNGDLLALWADYQKSPSDFKWDEEFQEIANKLYKHDVYYDTTYADVTTNGVHRFYFVDSAGNTAVKDVEVTGIDDTAPEVSSVAYRYNRLTGETYDTLAEVNGTVSLNAEKNLYRIETTEQTPVTNQSVTVTLTTDEPVVLYGSGNTVYSNTISKVFMDNGIYAFNLMDEAGNIAQVNVEVANILKRELHIGLESTDALVLFEGSTEGYDPSLLKSFDVYTYTGDSKTQVGVSAEKIDWGTFNPDDVNANTFNRQKPYVIRYTAWDEAGNKAELTRQVILCAKNDIVVMIDGILPDASGNIYVESAASKATVENYPGLTASVKMAKGQFNGAQMKTRGTIITETDGSYVLNFSEGEGWYTLYVRTLYQDLYVVRIYAGVQQ